LEKEKRNQQREARVGTKKCHRCYERKIIGSFETARICKSCFRQGKEAKEITCTLDTIQKIKELLEIDNLRFLNWNSFTTFSSMPTGLILNLPKYIFVLKYIFTRI